RISLNDWTPNDDGKAISSQYTTPGSRAYIWRVLSGGDISLGGTDTGNGFQGIESSIATPFSNGETGWVRTTFRASDQQIRWFTAPDHGDNSEPVSWTPLGVAKTMPFTSFFSSSADINIGAFDDGDDDWFDGKIYRVIKK